MSSYTTLMQQWTEIQHLNFFQRLASWDRECVMPAAATPQRTAHMVYLSGLLHERLCSNALSDALAAAEADSDTCNEHEQASLRLIRRQLDKEQALSSDWVSAFADQRGKNTLAWKAARAEKNFSLFEKHLGKTISLLRDKADMLSYADDPYDALHDGFEIGSTTADIQRLFANLAPACSDLLGEVAEHGAAPDKPPGPFSPAGQEAVTPAILQSMHFDQERGLVGETTHPFCSRLDGDDVRLAIRYEKDNVLQYIGALMHEAGHGLYNQGLPQKYLDQPVGDAVSLAIHESQSRLWENYVGRSRAYCSWLLPQMQQHFDAFADYSADDLYRLRNSVHQCRIRIEADEISYNLHIILRFEMELALLHGELNVADLPDAWNTRFEELFGYPVRDDAEGCLQDVHWSMGAFGYFPTYSMGNCYAAQFFHYARRALPDLDQQMASGDCSALAQWLGKQIYQQGSRYLPEELCIKVTGEHLNPVYLLNSLRKRYLP